METLEVHEARRRDRHRRRIQVLIVVKTQPQPSAQYEDTVCVAGIALDPPRWVRLYPIPFRHLEEEAPFKKYDIVDVEVRESPHDNRYESLKVNAESIVKVGHIARGRERTNFVEHLRDSLPSFSMCQLVDGARSDRTSASLGLVETATLKQIRIESGKPWTAKQEEILAAHAVKQELPGLGTQRFRAPLQPSPVIARLDYVCKEKSCRGHSQGIIAWELTALARRYRSEGFPMMEQAVRRNFFEQLTKDDLAIGLYVGNQHAIVRRRTFSVLGIYRAGKADLQEIAFKSHTLF